MRKLLLSACAALAIVQPARSAGQTIKLATLVPDGSVWDKELKGMGDEWRRITEGRVTLRIYAGGVAGDEPDVVRKMRIGQLHAGTLTVAGLADIDDAFTVFEIPMFYDSYGELFFVLERLRPTLEARLEAKGFVLVNWGHAGWVQLFSKRPVRRPEDLKELKLFVWAGDNRMVQWWKSNGFTPVALAATDIVTGLQTGMIEALPTTPLAALALQWYRSTPYMLDMGFAPLVGATIVTKRAWEGISEGDREVLLRSASEVEARLQAAIPDQDRRAIEEMARRGLEVVRVDDPAARETWTREAAVFADTMRRAMVPDDIFALAREAQQEFRDQEAAGSAGADEGELLTSTAAVEPTD